MYSDFKPSHLSNLIDAIWYADSDVDPNDGHIVSPSLGAQLVIKIYPSDIETVLSGPVTEQKQYPFVAGATYFGVQFAPSVGPVFDDLLFKDLKDTSADCNKVLGIDLASLAHQLHELNAWADQKHLLETTISKNYPETVDFLNPNVMSAMDIANAVYGNVSIKELAAAVGVSKRHLERLFLTYTGVSPKTFCTTLRIQHVLDRLYDSPSISLMNLALDCGYADQAHLANEFRRTMGMSISAYQRRK